MPISGDLYPFSEENVAKAPADNGVYALYKLAGRIHHEIYIGKAEQENGIRGRLQYHKRGGDECTKGAIAYRREIHDNPSSRERDLLIEYKRQYGALPSCNERIG